MSIAKTPSAEIAYKGFVQTRTNESLQTTITYQSTEEKLHAMVGATSGWEINKSYGDYGTLDKITIKQEAGPFWHADLQYNKPLKNGITINIGDANKPTESQLTVTMLEQSIKTNKNYTLIWDNYLAAKDGATNVPTEAQLTGLTKAQAIALVDNNPDLMWLEDKSQLPEEKWDDANQTYVKWKIAVYPTKEGIDYYVTPTYEITEYARHSNKENAAWSMATRNGRLKYPVNGDFGLEKKFFSGDAAQGIYHWLCLGGDLNFDGKYWVARCVYRWSPDDNGWDTELYDVADGGYGTPENGIINPILPNNNGGN